MASMTSDTSAPPSSSGGVPTHTTAKRHDSSAAAGRAPRGPCLRRPPRGHSARTGARRLGHTSTSDYAHSHLALLVPNRGRAYDTGILARLTHRRPESEGPLSLLTIVVCTRDRPEMLGELLDALAAESAESVAEIVVVDQGRRRPARVSAAASRPPITVIRDDQQGVSRARNLGVRRARTNWVAFLDDDCLPGPGWAARLASVCARHPAAGFVSGMLESGDRSPADLTVVGVQHVSWPRVRSGRWRTPPLAIGQGASFAVQRRVVERLGGWDERLGTGTRPFPAGEDLDFNYRFLRAGGVAYLTPELRVTHRQWRTETDLTRLHAGYLAGNAGCAIKHLRTDDLAGGAWLWLRLAWGVAFMFAGAIRTRSPLHRRLAVAQARGLALGTAEAFRHVW